MRAIKVQAALELKIANVPTVHWIILASDLEGKDREVKGYNGNTQLWNNALRKRKGKEGKEGKEW